MNCKNCTHKVAIKYSQYSTGEFCSRECARAYSTKNKRVEINKKVSKKLTGVSRPDSVIKKITGQKNGAYKNGKFCNKKLLKSSVKRKNTSAEKICEECSSKFIVEWKKRKQRFCCPGCARKNKAVRDKLSKSLSIAYSTKEAKDRLREIGRKGGFGKKGYTNGGVYYQSSLEKKCFELLEYKNIYFESHKLLPNSSKITDIYLPGINLWIELDGIDREKKKKWIGKDYDYWMKKMEIYKKEKLNLQVIKKFEEFERLVNNMAL